MSVPAVTVGVTMMAYNSRTGYCDRRLADRLIGRLGTLLRTVAGRVMRIVRGGAQLAIEFGLATRQIGEAVLLVQMAVARDGTLGR